MAENNNFNKKNKNLNSLLAGFDEKPPVSSSVPIKDFQMRIARDGIWYYQESPINRMRLVKLFASVLQKENDGTYWLITPVEKGLIDVDDAPFLAVDCDVSGEGADSEEQQVLEAWGCSDEFRNARDHGEEPKENEAPDR